MDDIDPFEILGVTPHDSYDTVSKKRLELLKKYHPDVNKSPGATEQTKKINLAWENYADQITRVKYAIRHRGNSNRVSPNGANIHYNTQRPPHERQTNNRQRAADGQEKSEGAWYQNHPDPEREWHDMREKLDREWKKWREDYEKWANGDSGMHWGWYQSEGLGKERSFYQRYSKLVKDWDTIQRMKRGTSRDRAKDNAHTSRKSANRSDSTTNQSGKHSRNSDFGYTRNSSKEGKRQSSTTQSDTTAHAGYTGFKGNSASGGRSSTSTEHTPEQNNHGSDSPRWAYILILILLILAAMYILLT